MSMRRTVRDVMDQPADGFSLIEVIVATGILATGLLSLAGVFSLGMIHMAGSTPALVAREKAREAVESVHTARDTGILAWDKIRNTPAPGVFLTGAQPLKTPGADGLVNTADDGPALEQQRTAGADKILGTADDLLEPLTDYTREIQISDMFTNGSTTIVNPNLRQIKVIVRFKVSGFWRTYTLTTYVSSFS
jgi:prepilin-type N-terminal cleavage/methylation domain-containing protein